VHGGFTPAVRAAVFKRFQGLERLSKAGLAASTLYRCWRWAEGSRKFATMMGLNVLVGVAPECLVERAIGGDPADPDDAANLVKRDTAQPERYDLLLASGDLLLGLRAVLVAAGTSRGFICYVIHCYVIEYRDLSATSAKLTASRGAGWFLPNHLGRLLQVAAEGHTITAAWR
jgi:hypothetical protein